MCQVLSLHRKADVADVASGVAPAEGEAAHRTMVANQLLPQLLQRRPKQLARHSSLASSKVRSHLMRSTTN